MITATARLTSIKCLVGRMEFNQDVGNNFTHNWFLCVRMQKLTTSKKGRFVRSFYIRCQIAIISSKYYKINEPLFTFERYR